MDRAANPDRDGDRRLNRRRFLRYTTTAGALAAGSPALTALAGGNAAMAEAAGMAAPRVPSFKWEEATIAELQAAMGAGTLTSRQLVEAYIQRIRQIDLSGAQLNSVIEINPDARAIADRLDRERRGNGLRGPLHGIPVLVKDNYATDDQMETTAGSLALLGSRVPRDAFVVKGLRDAGAVILGKANLSEWANFRSVQSSSGWSGRAGQCLNPYVLDHNPCGSSSGSGTAVSANLAAATLGTETDGSIVCPSSTNGVVGIKPTLGLTSRSGVVPIAHSQDVTGPMCRTVADAATVLGAMTGVDPRDPATAESQGHSFKDYRQFLDPNGLRGARIGVWREGVFGASPEADAVAEAAISQLSRLGATVVDPADIPNVNDAGGPEFTVLLFEFKADIANYLSELTNTSMRTLADLDAIMSLTGSPSWTTDLVNGDHFLTASSTPAAVAGFPNVTVPAGFVFDELPVGINFIGRQWDEPTLIKLAHGFEQGTKVRHAPKFLASLGVRDFVPRDTGVQGGSKAQSRRQGAPTAKPRGNPMAGSL